MVIDRGIDPKRMVIMFCYHSAEFRTQAIRVLDDHLSKPEGDRPQMMLCLDSLAMLSTTKEVEDTADGKEDTRHDSRTSSQSLRSVS